MTNLLVTIASLRSQSLEDLNLLLEILPTLVFEDVVDDMLSSSIFASSRLPNSTFDKRLQIGTFTTQGTEDTANGFHFVPTTHNAYICISGGVAQNQIALTYGLKNFKINVTSTTRVRYHEPFSSLDEDMTSESAIKKLRALGCSLFLAAGYLNNFKEYLDFFIFLRKACEWIMNNGQPPLKLPRLPLGEIQQNARNLAVEKKRYEEEDHNPQDDDELIKVETYESAATPFSSRNQSMLGPMRQVRLTSIGINVFGGSSQEPKRQKTSSQIRLGLPNRMKPLQLHPRKTHKDFTDLHNENAALKEINSTLLMENNKLKTRAALAESQNEELELMKSDLKGLREQLGAENERRRIEEVARLSEVERRKEAEAKLESLIQQQIDLISSYKSNK